MYLMFDHSGQQIVIVTTITKFMERLAVNKQRSQISYGEVRYQEAKIGRG
jgi:hypothetical protein